MRVEYWLPVIALLTATAGCGSDDGANMMAPSANAIDPALIDAALGPELAAEPGNALSTESDGAAAAGEPMQAAQEEPAASERTADAPTEPQPEPDSEPPPPDDGAEGEMTE